ncbi:Chaperone protein FimC [Pantoea sp. Nvir]|uniref:fimbrial assembly chaperone n=1 Tax=Pantoea sp. Nvir TaxID=2576760 RepID=UPI0030CB9E6E
MRSYRWWLVFSKALALFALLLAFQARAVVNVDKTRLVFNQGEISQTLNLKNGAESPTIVQIWSDEGDIMLSPELSKTPLIALPPVMKMSPGELRSVRVMLTSKAGLATDRESLYWLNIYQIPALEKSSEKAERKVVLPLRIRLKVFIRPAGLAAPQPADRQKLRFVVQGKTLKIVNPQPWFITLRLRVGDKLRLDNLMMAPHAQHAVPLDKTLTPGEKVSFSVLEDDGNPISFQGVVSAS